MDLFNIPTELGGPLPFVHRRIGGALKGAARSLVSGGNPFAGAIGGFTGSGRPRLTRAGPMLPARSGTERPRLTRAAPGPPPTFGEPRVVQQLTGPTRDRPGVRAAVARVLPGGRTGTVFAPFDLNTPTDKMGRPVAVVPELRERLHCPSGYVAVDINGDGFKNACVLKSVAKAMGLYKSRPKPPVSGYDERAITRAAAAKKRVAKLGKKVGLHVYTSARKSGGKKK